MVQVEEARTKLDAIVTKVHEKFDRPDLENQPYRLKAMVVHDKVNNAVWLKIPKNSPVRLTGCNLQPASCWLVPTLARVRTGAIASCGGDWAPSA